MISLEQTNTSAIAWLSGFLREKKKAGGGGGGGGQNLV